jgi:hypothetical protein
MRARVVAINILLLILWVPATSHCLMENAGIIPIAGCCAKSLTDCTQDDNCATGCDLVESTLVKSPTQTTSISLSSLTIAQLLPLLAPETSKQIALSCLFWPPDNFRLAEFLAHRTLPVRAPSSAS